MRDPIDKLQLRYALARLYESRGELDLARRTVDAMYAENPRSLGIVRQTADYYWRHKQGREAIAVLTRAASQAYPALKKQLTFEAASKSTEIAEYAQARELLKPLLADDPFNADYLAAVANSYALAREDGALRDFYKSTIGAMQSAPIDVARGGPVRVARSVVQRANDLWRAQRPVNQPEQRPEPRPEPPKPRRDIDR